MRRKWGFKKIGEVYYRFKFLIVANYKFLVVQSKFFKSLFVSEQITITVSWRAPDNSFAWITGLSTDPAAFLLIAMSRNPDPRRIHGHLYRSIETSM